MLLRITNNLDKKSYDLTLTSTEAGKIYYRTHITLPNGLPDGEFSYVLIDDNDKEISKGLMRVGDYIATKTTYKNNDGNYIQYNG